MRFGVHLLTILVLALLGLNAFFIYKSLDSPRTTTERTPGPSFDLAQAYILPVTEANYFPVLDSNVARPVLSGRSALVYDVRAERALYSKSPREKLPIASLTKLLTAVVAIENLTMNDVVSVGPESIRKDGERQDLFQDEKIRVDSLLKLMLINSSNDAAYALAVHSKATGLDLVAKMNEKAAALGMFDSSFLDPAGLDDRANSTAYDLLKLVRYALRYPFIWNALVQKEAAIASEDGGIVHHAKNTNQLLGVMPNIIGGKTGYTEAALGSLILLVDVPGQNDTIISIVIGSQERFSDTRNILEWVTSAYHWN